jgi:predicted nucleotide-binding protein
MQPTQAELLKTLIDLDCEYTSLNNVISYIQEMVPGLNLVEDPDLQSVGVDLSMRVVGFKAKGVPVERALDIILGLDLAYIIENTYVLITTRQKACQRLITHTYSASRLVGADYQGQWQELVDVIKRNINNMSDPNVAAWTDEGGPGAVDFFAGKLIVTQTLRGQESVVNLLGQLLEGECNMDTQPPGLKEINESADQGEKVFIVHGHDDLAKEAVRSVLLAQGIHPIILAEQASKGKGAIEKLEEYGPSACFAVVLITPDDVGASRKAFDRAKTNDEKVALLQSRARQNVIFELGFFIGKLGRRAVCPMYKGDREELVGEVSDYHGVVFIRMDDAGAWKTMLGKELEGAGFRIDLAKF